MKSGSRSTYQLLNIFFSLTAPIGTQNTVEVNCMDDRRTLVSLFKLLRAMCTKDITEKTEGLEEGGGKWLLFNFSSVVRATPYFSPSLSISQLNLPAAYCIVPKRTKLI